MCLGFARGRSGDDNVRYSLTYRERHPYRMTHSRINKEPFKAILGQGTSIFFVGVVFQSTTLSTCFEPKLTIRIKCNCRPLYPFVIASYMPVRSSASSWNMSLFIPLHFLRKLRGTAQPPLAHFFLDTPNKVHEPALGPVASEMHRLNAGLGC